MDNTASQVHNIYDAGGEKRPALIGPPASIRSVRAESRPLLRKGVADPG